MSLLAEVLLTDVLTGRGLLGQTLWGGAPGRALSGQALRHGSFSIGPP